MSVDELIQHVRDNPDESASAIDELFKTIDTIEQDNLDGVSAALAIESLAENNPEILIDHVPEINTALKTLTNLRAERNLVKALEHLAESYPDHGDTIGPGLTEGVTIDTDQHNQMDEHRRAADAIQGWQHIASPTTPIPPEVTNAATQIINTQKGGITTRSMNIFPLAVMYGDQSNESLATLIETGINGNETLQRKTAVLLASLITSDEYDYTEHITQDDQQTIAAIITQHEPKQIKQENKNIVTNALDTLNIPQDTITTTQNELFPDTSILTKLKTLIGA